MYVSDVKRFEIQYYDSNVFGAVLKIHGRLLFQRISAAVDVINS